MLAAGTGEWMIAKLLRGGREQCRTKHHVERRIGILASPRALEWISAVLDRPFDVAGPPGNSAQIFELVVMGFELVVGHAPVLDRHRVGNRSGAIALRIVAARDEIRRKKPPGHAIPMDAGAADAGAGQKRTELAHRQRGLARA